MSLDSLLTQTCEVYTRISTTDSRGGPLHIYNKLYSDVYCRAVHMKNVWGNYAGRISAQATHLLYIHSDCPALDTTMRVKLDDGVWYQVEHADMKHDWLGNHHPEYEIFAVESPQGGG